MRETEKHEDTMERFLKLQDMKVSHLLPQTIIPDNPGIYWVSPISPKGASELVLLQVVSLRKACFMRSTNKF